MPCAAATCWPPAATAASTSAPALGRQGADRALQERGLRDDVVGRARLDVRDGDHGGVEDVDPPGHHRLQRQHDLGGRPGSGRRPRAASRRARPARARYPPLVGRGHHRPGPHVDVPLATSSEMCSANAPLTGASRDDVQQPLLEHEAGAVEALLARLHHEHDLPGQLRRAARRAAGRRRAASRRGCRGRRRASRRAPRRRTPGRCPRARAARPCRRAAGRWARVARRASTPTTELVRSRWSPRSAGRRSASSTVAWVRGRCRPISGCRCSRRRRSMVRWRRAGGGEQVGGAGGMAPVSHCPDQEVRPPRRAAPRPAARPDRPAPGPGPACCSTTAPSPPRPRAARRHGTARPAARTHSRASGGRGRPSRWGAVHVVRRRPPGSAARR